MNITKLLDNIREASNLHCRWYLQRGRLCQKCMSHYFNGNSTYTHIKINNEVRQMYLM